MSDQNTAQSQPSDDAVQTSNSQKLDTFSAILDEIDQQSPQQQERPVSQATGGASKEQLEGSSAAHQELPGGMQQVESEPNPEIPPELESYLQKVEEADQQETERQLADLSEQYASQADAGTPKTAKVLPITKEQEKRGFKKSALHSIRWLVEYSHKMTKMFLGRAVYRQPDATTESTVGKMDNKTEKTQE